MKFKFRFKQSADQDITTIYIDGEVGQDLWKELFLGEKSENTIEEFRKKLADVTTSKIRVVINSYGGDVKDGISMMDELLKFDGEVETVVEGLTASVATVISQGAGTGLRKMSKNALMLVHQAMVGICGWMNRNKIEQIQRNLETVNNHAARIYAERCGKDQQYFLDLMAENNGDGIWLTADEALEHGLIDEIIDYSTPADDIGAGQHNLKSMNGMDIIHATAHLPEIPKGKLAALKNARSREIQLLTLKYPTS
jgi:ATP-dependent Clp protease, protease subunit